MADKELKRLKRRELLEMLLIQCQETERLQMELNEIKERHREMEESYDRLKKKLDVKDERLNQKDARIAELGQQVEEMKKARVRRQEEGTLAEAIIRGAFEEARQAVERYLKETGRRRNEAAVGEQQSEAGIEEKRMISNPRKVTRIRKKNSVSFPRVASGDLSGR